MRKKVTNRETDTKTGRHRNGQDHDYRRHLADMPYNQTFHRHHPAVDVMFDCADLSTLVASKTRSFSALSGVLQSAAIKII